MSASTPPKIAKPATPAVANPTVQVVPPVAAAPAVAKAGAAGGQPGAPASVTKPGKPAGTPAASTTPAAPFGEGVLPVIVGDEGKDSDLPDLTAEPEGDGLEGLGEGEGDATGDPEEIPAAEGNAEPIEYVFKTPEGHEPLENMVLAPLAQWLNAQKVPQAEAQALVDVVVPALQQAGRARLTAMLASGETELRARHGEKLPDVMRLAAAGLKHAGPGFRELFKKDGLLSMSPDTIDFLAKVGGMRVNDRPPQSARRQVPKNLTAQDELAAQYDDAEKKFQPQPL